MDGLRLCVVSGDHERPSKEICPLPGDWVFSIFLGVACSNPLNVVRGGVVSQDSLPCVLKACSDCRYAFHFCPRYRGGHFADDFVPLGLCPRIDFAAVPGNPLDAIALFHVVKGHIVSLNRGFEKCYSFPRSRHLSPSSVQTDVNSRRRNFLEW